MLSLWFEEGNIIYLLWLKEYLEFGVTANINIRMPYELQCYCNKDTKYCNYLCVLS